MGDKGGGVFLSALKEKNEVRKQQLKTSQSTLKMTKKKSSIFGSFLGTKANGTKQQTTTILEAARESRESNEFGTVVTAENQVVTTRTQLDQAENSAPVVMTTHIEKTTVETSVKSQQEEHDVTKRAATEPVLVSQQTTTIATITSSVEDDRHRKTEATVFTKHSDAIAHAEPYVRDVASTDHVNNPRRERRSSTTAESPKRRSSVVAHPREQSMDSLHGRDRTPSMATIDTVYGRLGKDNRNFEMANPLLSEPGRSSVVRRELSVTHSAAEVDAERAKRASLYNSAPHVDQTILLERRNTRAGRSPSIDVRDGQSVDEIRRYRSQTEEVAINSS